MYTDAGRSGPVADTKAADSSCGSQRLEPVVPGAAQRGSSRDPATRPGDATGLSKKVTWADYTRRTFLTTKIFKKRTTKWWTSFSRKRWTPHALHPQRPLGGEHGSKWPPRTVRAATDGSSPVEGCLAHPKDSPSQGDGLRGEAALGGVSSAPHSSVRHRVTSKCSRRSPGDRRDREAAGPRGTPCLLRRRRRVRPRSRPGGPEAAVCATRSGVSAVSPLWLPLLSPSVPLPAQRPVPGVAVPRCDADVFARLSSRGVCLVPGGAPRCPAPLRHARLSPAAQPSRPRAVGSLCMSVTAGGR